MKAIGMYIFGGSQTIGHLLEGWEIDTILEMTNDMIDHNAYHFHKNYPNIDIKLPADMTNEYLDTLVNKYDLLFANPPCSGLSTINRNANVNNEVNKYIYNVIDVANKIKPKIFFIENAPTLTSIGLSILKNIAKAVHDDYYLLIINDKAGNHNVPMYRRRTFVIGFNKTYFKGIPKLNTEYVTCTVADILSTIDLTHNKEFLDDSDTTLFKYYDMINNGDSLYRTLATNEVEDIPDSIKSNIDKFKYKLDNGLRIWDKSPSKLCLDGYVPSLTSLSRLIHPIENRDLYIREYAAIMGYPNNFIFYADECKTPTVQCIAQGVPVNFIRYISKELMNSFSRIDYLDGEIVYINQTNANNVKIKIYKTLNDFSNTLTII